MSHATRAIPSFDKPYAHAACHMDQAASEYSERHAELILSACQKQDKIALVELCTRPGGLLNDTLRQQAWPILLQSNQAPVSADLNFEAAVHQDEDQVTLDVNRAFVYYPEDDTDGERTQRKLQLNQLIISTLRAYPNLCYFQGYHDIAQVCLLVLGPTIALPVLTSISLRRIRDFMLPSLTPTLEHLRVIPSIIQVADPDLHVHLSHQHALSAPPTSIFSLSTYFSMPSTPFFAALPATLTLYSHEISNYTTITRLFDFLLAHPPIMSLYFFVALIQLRRAPILEIDPQTEPELIHAILAKLPSPLPIEDLLMTTTELYEQYPPQSLPGRSWSRISCYSALKSTPTSLSQAYNQFNLQREQLRTAERQAQRVAKIWKLRRPVAAVSLAFAVAGVAYSLQRTSPNYLMHLLAHFHHLHL